MSNLLIIGGGYAGVWATIGAARRASESDKPLNIRLISKDEFLTHRPRLYERQHQDMRTPLRPVLEPIGVGLTVATVKDISPSKQQVTARHADGQDHTMTMTPWSWPPVARCNSLPLT